MKRENNLDRLTAETEPWDFIVIGGGATGLGTAVDAAARGYRTLLVERRDFALGTSSRSTKLVHGGVRYLRQGNVSLVLESLRERGRLEANAPHLVHRLGFVIPAYSRTDRPFYGTGMKLYDRLAGPLSLGRSRFLSRRETIDRLPTVNQDRLRGGVLYFDAQFDDARLAINLARTAHDHGAAVINDCEAVGLERRADRLSVVQLRDRESGAELEVRGRCVINAAGVFADAVRRLDDRDAPPNLVFSQGSHLVLPKEFHPGDNALMVPKTADGRVLFGVPWHDRVIVGTTDVAVKEVTDEPAPRDEELEFLREHAGRYLQRTPRPGEILSAYSGLRPLVSPGSDGARTASISRDHTISVSASGLVTIMGGKWTTYRRMAADVVDRAETAAGFQHRACSTVHLPIHGAESDSQSREPLGVYGSDAAAIESLAVEDPGLAKPLHPDLPCIKAELVWAARHEMARTLEDVLARRTRSLVLNARAAIEAAPEAARLLAGELNRNAAWREEQQRAFEKLAGRYLVPE